MDIIKKALPILMLVMSVVSFAAMGADKKKAKDGARRTPEKTLFFYAALFGGIGGTAGMFVFRHKTKHWYFRVGFPLLAAVQAALLMYILRL